MSEDGSDSGSTDDASTLRAIGYAQELARRMSGFSNFALSLSIICILSGGVTSFHLGLCSVGGASIGLGWPLAWCFSMTVASTMAQLASAYPTAGGLYHWAAILGGRGWGWATAWLNLAGLVAALAAVDVGAYRFAVDALGLPLGTGPVAQAVGVGLIAASQAAVNHVGIRAVARLTDLSGYLILIVSAALVVGLLAFAPDWDFGRLVTFANYSGEAGANTWPRTGNLALLFLLGLLLPAYTITGFDASAHAAEETIDAARVVPKGIVRSVLVSGLAGWVLLGAVVVAIPSLDEAASEGVAAFGRTLHRVLPAALATPLIVGIVATHYVCGLATITSASRTAYAFARDGGLPFSAAVRRVSPRFRTPAVAIWAVTASAILFIVHTPVYETMSAVCTIFLYLSYVIPTALGLLAYGRTWTVMGPWRLGAWYRPLAVVSVVGCLALIVIGVQPPNDRASLVVGALAVVLLAGWFGRERRRFPGPPMPGLARRGTARE